ncbi:hypothetical protein EVAR_56610_1 [Eumeta japonica]|uniref:Uncharacterized protein n=1 Tax=Eumeta variegata TaxID=151549 RepID=A0A4C1Z148_EUMVA|nr:hypothetical protein EVAR_56610_1 [Eumeta japonica]
MPDSTVEHAIVCLGSKIVGSGLPTPFLLRAGSTGTNSGTAGSVDLLNATNSMSLFKAQKKVTHSGLHGCVGSPRTANLFIAKAKTLIQNCFFQIANNLEEAILDKFVMEMRAGHERDKLSAQNIKELVLIKAVDLVESIRCARTGAVASSEDERFLLCHSTILKINSDGAAADTGASTSASVHREGDWYEAGGTKRR